MSENVWIGIGWIIGWIYENPWIVIGFVGQGLFMGRFLVQWIASERAQRSIIPTAFWFFSLGGGMTLLAYAVWRRDPVFIVGQGAGLAIYLRNLWFIREEKQAKLGVAGPATQPARS